MKYRFYERKISKYFLNGHLPTAGLWEMTLWTFCQEGLLERKYRFGSPTCKRRSEKQYMLQYFKEIWKVEWEGSPKERHLIQLQSDVTKTIKLKTQNLTRKED